MNPKHYRTFLIVVIPRCPYIYSKTILTYIIIMPVVSKGQISVCIEVFQKLWSSIGPIYGWINIFPGFRFPGRHTPVLSSGIRSIWYSEKIIDVLVNKSPDLPESRFGNGNIITHKNYLAVFFVFLTCI